MDPRDVNAGTLLSIVRDPARRAALLAAVQAETGAPLPLHNAIDRAAETCVATADELAEMVDLLLAEDSENRVLDSLVFHADMPEHCLYRLLDAGRCIDSLGHRGGPEQLLLRIAAEHPEQLEAVLTLALLHYGPAPDRRERFLEFVRDHLHVDWLRQSLRMSDLAERLPRDRLAAALELVEAYEQAH